MEVELSDGTIIFEWDTDHSGMCILLAAITGKTVKVATEIINSYGGKVVSSR